MSSHHLKVMRTFKTCTLVSLIVYNLFSFLFSYLVMHLMGSDVNNILKQQALTDEHVQFLVYQILRGLKVTIYHIIGVILFSLCSMSIQLVLSIE